MGEAATSKFKDNRGGGFSKWRRMVHGDVSMAIVFLIFGYIPGPIGMALRKVFYPWMFRRCGNGVVFGYGVTFRHPHKIALGDGVFIDDFAMLDAKGETNAGIEIGDEAFIGRGTKIYCKNGDIALGRRTNVSSFCTLYSNNSLKIGAGCMIGAYSYILSGGEYDWRDPTPYAEQSGMCTKGPLTIGDDCWIGTRVTILDGAQSVGDRALVAACALVIKPVPPRTIVGGVPAKILGNAECGMQNAE
jgi:acetyltransferase-like isoleucine patch superfamily enzyme